MKESTETNQSQPILIDTIATASGHAIGTLTLNDPKALNALSVDMCQMISKQLSNWQNDDNIVAILLKGSGDKAFCAGGNIRKLYESMLDNPPMPNPYAEEFFSSEYSLFRQMHFYNKPIVLWANGIVMGGGMGLMAMCSHRVVTETTRFAMPEITIGLYPDATGSWLLQRFPAKLGLFLGLTGANCNGADALIGNMAEFAVTSEQYDDMVHALSSADWANSADLHDTASQALATVHHTEQLAESNLINHWQALQAIVNAGDIHAIDQVLQNAELAEKYKDDKWMSRAISTYQHGCPVTAGLTFEAFKRAKKLSLEQILYMEMNLSLHCANNPDFREGVRALLIDKDRTPKWSKTLAECGGKEGRSYIDSHFNSPYDEGKHPFENWLDNGSKSADLVNI
ncbi:enoyl-CoA hydratase/isomerase family protein [Psychrobacter sp. HD31]|uniref:enoyl-CoA hydratase/isomerase family protein n=1 Tax=Psychrobacter sp. HD31 TaxID=3112003 RepID=UPI003DA553A6